MTSIPNVKIRGIGVFPDSGSQPDHFVKVSRLRPLKYTLQCPTFRFLRIFSGILYAMDKLFPLGITFQSKRQWVYAANRAIGGGVIRTFLFLHRNVAIKVGNSRGIGFQFV